jgi:hypothetical protein
VRMRFVAGGTVSMSAGEKLGAPRPTSYQIVVRGQLGQRTSMRWHGGPW